MRGALVTAIVLGLWPVIAASEALRLTNVQTFAVRPGFVQDVLRAVGGDKDRPIALICARGNRSAFAQDLLERAGFADVQDISEGLQNSHEAMGCVSTAPHKRLILAA